MVYLISSIKYKRRGREPGPHPSTTNAKGRGNRANQLVVLIDAIISWLKGCHRRQEKDHCKYKSMDRTANHRLQHPYKM